MHGGRTGIIVRVRQHRQESQVGGRRVILTLLLEAEWLGRGQQSIQATKYVILRGHSSMADSVRTE